MRLEQIAPVAAPGPAPAPEPPGGEPMTTAARLRLVVVLGSLIAIAPLTIDTYLPALPSIAAGLDTTPAAVQLTLTGTLLGLALGQLLIGPLSDAVGRRRPLIAGIAVHVVASLLCVVAPTVGVLGVLRVLQGLGAAAATVVATAIVRDLFDGAAFARLFSRLMLVMGAAPILAPTLGGAMLRWTSWRGIFVLLAVLGTGLVVVGVLALRETLPAHRRRTLSPGGVVRDYAALVRDRTFVGLVLVAGLAIAALFAYVSGSSFVLQEGYGLSEQQFGLVFGAGAFGLIAATQLNARLLRRYSPRTLLTVALATGTVAGVVLVLFAATGIGGLPALLVPLWVVLAAGGVAIPNAPALALTRHGEAAGTASALLGAVQFGVGALSAPLVGVLGTGAVAMAAVIAGAMALATAVFLVVGRGLDSPAPSAPLPAAASAPLPAAASASAEEADGTGTRTAEDVVGIVEPART
jgi:DHA1 family bicyclomycin/chloramphenicol resistance-like MFS transporter